jgi:hypothetical protein
MIRKMNKKTSLHLVILINRNLQFLSFHLSLKEYFLVLDLYKLSYYDVDNSSLSKSAKNKF